jgi:hypothetical protein
MTDKPEIPKFGPGTEVYWDCFAGMLKGVLLKFTKKEDVDEVEIKITTKTNRVYHFGERITTNATWVFPRAVYRETRPGYYVLRPYEWIDGPSDQAVNIPPDVELRQHTMPDGKH